MSTDIKHFEAEISKIIQTRGVSGSLLSKLTGSLMKIAIALVKIVLALY